MDNKKDVEYNVDNVVGELLLIIDVETVSVGTVVVLIDVETVSVGSMVESPIKIFISG